MAPLIFVPIDYLIAAAASSLFLPGHELILRAPDFLLQLALGFFLYAFSRSALGCALAQLVLMLTLYVGNAIKISFLGGPILPSDAYSLGSLFLILDLGLKAALLAVPLTFLALVTWNFRLPSRRREIVALALLVLAWVGFWARPEWTSAILDRSHTWHDWSQLENYRGLGATAFLARAWTRARQSQESSPDQQAARTALRRLLAGAPQDLADRPPRERSVYLIVLESFWDASELVAAKLSEDPLAPGFRRLWDEGGRSSALSPVFAGGTSDAELELLCGMPGTFVEGSAFMYALTNDAPCLPRILARRGYPTFAAHANVAAFWNRTSVYRRVGFDSTMFKPDFDLSDQNGSSLADASFYRQALDRLDAIAPAPRFAYLLTISGHWPYPLDESRRPARVQSASTEPSVGPYANSLWYSSQELVGAIDEIRRREPEAIIVAVGDHLPFLGENFAGYVESGILPASWADFTGETARAAVRTPLLVIDGERGSVPVGEIPMFGIPALILDLLGAREPTIANAFRVADEERIRPFRGARALVTSAAGEPVLCTPESPGDRCARAGTWMRDAEVLWHDILHGEQFALAEAGLRPPTYIAHAGGGIDGRTYTNSAEALERNHALGHRFFEIDFSWTKDGELALIHDWQDHFLSVYAGARDVPTRGEFLRLKRHDGFTPMTLPELLAWLEAHPDAWIVTDVKERNVDGLARIAASARGLRSRFVPQIYEQSELERARALGFEDVIFTLYRTAASDDDVVRFAAESDLFAVTMPAERALGTDLPSRIRDLGVPVYAHTVNDADIERKLLARGVTGLYTDFLPRAQFSVGGAIRK
jgi:glycerophosphoryl diester phosphodiesterase